MEFKVSDITLSKREVYVTMKHVKFKVYVNIYNPWIVQTKHASYKPRQLLDLLSVVIKFVFICSWQYFCICILKRICFHECVSFMGTYLVNLLSLHWKLFLLVVRVFFKL